MSILIFSLDLKMKERMKIFKESCCDKISLVMNLSEYAFSPGLSVRVYICQRTNVNISQLRNINLLLVDFQIPSFCMNVILAKSLFSSCSDLSFCVLFHYFIYFCER
jgi:hypothetical protein